MEKIKVKETIFRKQNDHNPIPFKDITIKLEPEDVIKSGYDEGFYSENNSWDPYFYLEVERERLETDEEFEKRKKHNLWLKRDSNKRLYDNFLKLKEKFELSQERYGELMSEIHNKCFGKKREEITIIVNEYLEDFPGLLAFHDKEYYIDTHAANNGKDGR